MCITNLHDICYIGIYTIGHSLFMDNNCLEIGECCIDSSETIVSQSPLLFRYISKDSLPLIHPYLQNANSLSCDYTVGCIYMWIDYFKYKYCIYQDTLFIKGVAEDDISKTAFSLPIGKLSLDSSVSFLKEYCADKGLHLVFSAITPERID